jgi:hypothetical protein
MAKTGTANLNHHFIRARWVQLYFLNRKRFAFFEWLRRIGLAQDSGFYFHDFPL